MDGAALNTQVTPSTIYRYSFIGTTRIVAPLRGEVNTLNHSLFFLFIYAKNSAKCCESLWVKLEL